MISEYLALAKLDRMQLNNSVKEAFRRSPVLMSGLVLGGCGFYYLYWRVIWFLMHLVYKQDVYGVILSNKIIQVLFFIALGMAIMSSLTTSISQLYMSKDLEFQFGLPVRFFSWFLYRFGQVFFQSSWMLFAFGAPILWVYLSLADAGILMRIAGLAVFAMICSFPVMATTIMCMFLVKIFPARRVHQVFLVLTVILTAALVFLFRYMEPEQFIGPGAMERFRGAMDLINIERYQWNPAVWASNLITAIAFHTWEGVSYNLIRLLSVFTAVFAILILLAFKLYRPSWDRALQSFSGEGDLYGLKYKRENRLVKGLSSFNWSQECRETILFFRDPTQWSQIFVLGALLALYLFSIYKLQNNPFGGTMFAMALGNMAFVGFVCLSISSRFVFTSFSADGEALWIMKTTPDGWSKYSRSKFLIYGLPTVAFSLALTLFSAKILDISTEHLVQLTIFGLWDSLFCVLLALAFGMLFINIGVENPLKLIVSPPGFLLMAVGASILGLHSMLRLAAESQSFNYAVMHIGIPDVQDGRALRYYLGLLLLEGTAVLLLIRKGMRHLRRGEFY